MLRHTVVNLLAMAVVAQMDELIKNLSCLLLLTILKTRLSKVNYTFIAIGVAV